MTNNKTTRDCIGDGLTAYKKLAKHSLKTRWNKMDLHEKCDAARALVVMGIVAKESDCFSRENTESAWRYRAEKYAKEHNFEDVKYAYYFAQDPAGIIWNQARYALEYPLIHQYYRFLSNVQKYEYENGALKSTYAQEVKKDSLRVCDMVDVIESKPVVRMFKKFVRNFTR